MNSENKFSVVMSKKTDAELIRILTTDKDNYQKLALEAAVLEFRERNLSVEQIKGAKKINYKINSYERKKANEPLDIVSKIEVFLIPTRAFIQSGLYYSEGYEKKSKELMEWCYYGIAFYAIIFFFMWLFN